MCCLATALPGRPAVELVLGLSARRWMTRPRVRRLWLILALCSVCIGRLLAWCEDAISFHYLNVCVAPAEHGYGRVSNAGSFAIGQSASFCSVQECSASECIHMQHQGKDVQAWKLRLCTDGACVSRTSRRCSLVPGGTCLLAASLRCEEDGSDPARSTNVTMEYVVETSGFVHDFSSSGAGVSWLKGAPWLLLSTMMVTI
jgi:hypothetical protein